MAIGKKTKKVVDAEGVAHVNATFNNTLITITDAHGNAVAWGTAGKAGFKGSKKSTPFAATVADATVRPDVHEALDVHRNLGAQRALDPIHLLDLLTELVDVGVGKIPDALLGVHPGRLEDAARQDAPDAVDVGQADLDLLVARKIHAGNTSHSRLTLTLLVLGIALADDARHTRTLHHLAVLADRLDAATNFHGNSRRTRTDGNRCECPFSGRHAG